MKERRVFFIFEMGDNDVIREEFGERFRIRGGIFFFICFNFLIIGMLV